MSIRSFANVPCATCNQDTLHIGMKCTVCGTVTLTAAAQTHKAHQERKQRYIRFYGAVKGLNMLTSERIRREKINAKGRREQGERYQDLPRVSRRPR